MKILVSLCVLSTLILFPCSSFLLSALAIHAEEIALTSAPYDHGPPQWSPDGNWIMFTNFLTDTSWQIAKVLSSGGEEIPVTSVHWSAPWWVPPYFIRWSPDGNWLSYVVETEEPPFLRRTIYKVTTSGGTEIPLKMTANYFAEWSPDGNWIAHEGKYPDTAETNFIVGLCKMPASGGANVLLTTTGWPGYAQWSPDGTWIAYFGRDHRIYKVPSSGGTAIPLTVEQPDLNSFDWSPDCAWIAYSCFNGYYGGIYKISSLGGPEIQLTDDPGQGLQWSPDGNWIAYWITYWGGIKMVSASGDTIVSWTESGEAPQWSPDGNWIVYTKIDSTEYSQIYKVRRDSIGSISGHVRFEDGTPLANVEVQALIDDEVEGVGTTDNEGYYEIEGLPPENYRVRACFNNAGDLVRNYHNEQKPSEADVEVIAGEETSDIDIIFPLPMVMVHGHWPGRPASWNTARTYFQQDPAIRDDGSKAHICFVASAFSVRWRLGTNGAVLHGFIKNNVIPRFYPNVPKINILAHSMGGLISRFYIHKYDTDENVNRLLMLGTPNGGVRAAGIIYYRYPILRAIGDMTIHSMRRFNSIIRDSREATFCYFAGRGDGGIHMLECWPPLGCPYPYRYSDGLIGEWSVFNCISRSDFCFADAHHGELHEHPYIDGVLEVLEDKLYSAPCGVALTRDNQFASAEDSIQFSPAIGDSVLGGETKQYQIVIDESQQVSFSLNWVFGELDLVLYDPYGSLIDSAVAASDPDIEYMPYDSLVGLPVEQYTIQNPASGTWTLEVSAINTPLDSALLFFVMATMKNNLSLSITTDKEYYTQAEPVLITATLTESGSPKIGAAAYARIMRPDYSIDSLDLFDDGVHNDGPADDGVYGNSYTNTSMGGRYSLSVTASGLTTGGDEFERQEILEFDVNPNTAHFTGSYSDQGVDVDEDGFFDSLRIAVGVAIDSAGDYEIVASLVDSNGTEIDIANYGETGLSMGTHNFILDFSGQKIRDNGVDGPYYLKDLRLFDETDILIQADYEEDAYTTSHYFVSEFTTVEEQPTGSPKTFALFQSYPNPFNAESNIRYVLARGCFVKLTIYNILGKKVKVLVNEYQNAGDKLVRWDGKNENGNNVASGIYFYRLNAGDFTETKKMLLLK